MAWRFGHTQHQRESTTTTALYLAVTTKTAGPLGRVGVPEMTPVEPLSVRPAGSSGLTAYLSIGPDTAGANAMASPTTAGKGCEPLYENPGCECVTGSPPSQAASQHRR